MNREEIEALAGQVRQLSLVLPIQDAEFQSQVDKNIGKKNAVKKVEQAYLAMADERDAIRSDLQKAIATGNKFSLPMPNCRKLAESLQGGLDCPSPLDFVFDSTVELKALSERTKKGSRVQPEHPITTWVRQHGHKYENNKKAVQEYCSIHGGNVDKLYSDLMNDKKKHRNQQPKQG